MNKQQLKALQIKWKKKLKASGFVDAEDDKQRLITYHGTRFTRKKHDFPFTMRYYELARQMLFSFPFTTRESKRIWALHSEGYTAIEIADMVDLHEDTVNKAITPLKGHIVLDGK